MTERSWKTMEEGVEEYVSELIKFRKKEVAGNVFWLRLRDLDMKLDKWREMCPDANVLKPTSAEVAVREPLRTVLLKDLDWSVTDPLKSVEDAVLVRLGRECMDEMRAYLLGLIPGRVKGKSRGTGDRLALATTYFKCFRCKEPMPYVRITVHQCFKDLPAGREDEDGEDDTTITITSMLKAARTSAPLYRTTDKVFFDEEASRHAEVLIRACENDPNKTTFADMEALDARLECVACEPGKRRQAMQWRSALLHSIQHHYATDNSPISARWKVINDPDELQRIEAAEKPAIEKGQVVRQCRGGYRIKVPACSNQEMWNKALREQSVAYAQDSSMANFPPFVRF
ncbi:uncharacterized protein SCHCODRAFT_02635541 [Schizophyllum commune H4-8]|uniref:Expressed protein n=1 Tax=Schizophyllum commune (strain H4-8 / FGSC 9210) TaxID=578458 RepID=D8QCW9_SCHCM|nr:uncharacterized protein SCHCODRAFT_02635541 [Schizophyllum commune H4-8]KAI5889760.1 hypothetical protein SCHCODRAFT_02635541 [Schizophyllum commune H4-8]